VPNLDIYGEAKIQREKKVGANKSRNILTTVNSVLVKNFMLFNTLWATIGFENRIFVID
jgi:hypothetical protein